MPKLVLPIILLGLAVVIQPVFVKPLFAKPLFSKPLFAKPLLPNFTAYYSLSKGPIKFGKTVRSNTQIDDKHFLFKSVTIPKGIATMFTEGEITEQSKWVVHEKAIRPIEYSYINTASKKKRDVKLLFDWHHQTVTNIINGDPWKMELAPGTQDKLVYQLSVMLDLSNQQKDLEYLVADGGKLKTYTIKISGEEQIEIALGTFKTTKITRTGKKPTTIFWCAQELNFLPIKITQIKDLGNITATLYKLEGIKIPASNKPQPKAKPPEDSYDEED